MGPGSQSSQWCSVNFRLAFCEVQPSSSILESVNNFLMDPALCREHCYVGNENSISHFLDITWLYAWLNQKTMFTNFGHVVHLGLPCMRYEYGSHSAPWSSHLIAVPLYHYNTESSSGVFILFLSYCVSSSSLYASLGSKLLLSLILLSVFFYFLLIWLSDDK